ncbi:MAG: flagellar biosynthesis anti-sigma factor FlgM [Phycisphaerae bacterium]|nr:flagellar biosynthesis anti-sigma factor FlgM [Phycisphaerae bacterium]
MEFRTDLEKLLQDQQEQELTAFRRLDDLAQEGEEELLENINSTPLGQLLKIIAQMPEVRREKVIDLRERLNRGHYDEQEYLDEALDRVLEELIAEE